MIFRKLVLACFLTLVTTIGQVRGEDILTTEGSQLLYLTTGPEENGGGISDFDRSGDGGLFGGEGEAGEFGEEFDIAVWSYEFFASPGSTIEFDYNVLTSEVLGGVPDPFEVTLNGATILAGAIGEENGSFPAVTGFNGVMYFGPDGSFFEDGQLGFATASGSTDDGLNTLEFFIGDEADEVVDSALLIDAIRLDGTLLEGFESYIPGEPPGIGVLPTSGALLTGAVLPTSTVLAGSVTVQGQSDFVVAIVPEPTCCSFLSLGVLGLAVRRCRKRQSA